MIRVVGCVLLILSGYLGGLYFSNSCKMRLEQLYELKRIIQILEGEIRYKKTALPEAFFSVAKRTKPPFSNFFCSVAKELLENRKTGMGEIWKEKVEKLLGESKLAKNDKNSLIQLGNSLGYLDGRSQIDSLQLYMEQLCEEIKKSREELYKKGKVYQCLGVSSGILLVLIFL
ncbi:MAG: stage III sporulation protein AB [Lachnospiraceae bacterium]